MKTMDNDYLTLLKEVNGIGTWKVDLINNTVEWDDRVKEIHEVPQDYTPNLETGINFYKEGYSREKITEVVTDCIQNGSSYNVELQIVTANNTDKWVRAIGRCTRNEKGEPSIMYGTFEDIEVYRQREDIVEKSGLGFWSWDLKTNHVEFSNGWKLMKGYKIEEIEDSFASWEKLVHPEDLSRVLEHVQELIDGKIDICRNEYRVLAKNGNWVWVHDQSKIVERAKNGKPTIVMGTHLDITLRIEEQKVLNRFFELSVDYMCIANTDGYFKKVNRAFIDNLGFEEKELLNTPILDLIHPDDIENTAKEFEKLNDPSYRTINFINRYKKKSGEYIWFNWVCQPYETGALYAAARDITEEIRLRDIEKEAIELRHETLAAQKVAENKQQFLANMSHEIRTPMNGIVGMIDILEKKGDLTDKHIQYIDVIKTSSLSLLNIINDILDLSKLEEGKMKFVDQKFELNHCFNNINELFSAKSVEKGIDLKCTIDENLPSCVIGDEHRLKQILSNLVSNALKFTEKGSVEVIVKKQEQKENKVLTILFEIKDTGIGISEEETKSIFQSYEQLNSSSTKQYAGTGLGLGISKKIVELFGGEIWVKSEVNKGSSFFFTINIKEDEFKPGNSLKQTRSTPANFNDKKILLVDDKKVNLTVAELMLKKLGCNITIATNGIEAIQATKSGDFDIIFMDIQMPIMDGMEATGLIKEGKLSKAPIVALTANAMEGDKEKYLESGFDGYLPKPIQFDALSNCMNEFL